MDDSASSHGAPARAPLPDAWWRLPLRTRRLIAAGIVVGKVGTATAAGSDHRRTNNHGYGYGMRL